TATRGGEAAFGIDALLEAPEAGRPEAVAGYLEVVQAERAEFGPTTYPGSPAIAARLLRPDDRLVVCETHPEDNKRLAKLFQADTRVRVMASDGWTAVKAELPPPSRRGVTLIDPPYEQAGEHDRLMQALAEGRRRFATGVYLLWYPIKARGRHRDFIASLRKSQTPDLWSAELRVWSDRDPDRLNGAGLIICNPPYGFLDGYLDALRYLARVCGRDRHAGATLVDLSG
ncbi:MAG: 23S rRNA (adenine(2030)-N(6))-methyltransferase RlmJ, partial [Pseudomonadota bacterium]